MDKVFTIDLGGTHTKIAVIDQNGNMTEKQTTNTPDSLYDLLDYIQNEVSYSDTFAGISISAPGAVSNNGIIYGASAIPYIHGPNLKELIHKRTGLPVEIENDANCAAMAEIWKGNAKGKKNIIVMVLGTGVGGSIIKDGNIHKGANLHAGEFGCMVLNSNSLENKMEIFSNVASTSSIIRRVAKAKSIDPDTLSGENIFALAEKGDAICNQSIQEFYYMLALGIYNLQYMYDPELILIGGGISERENLTTCVKKELEQIVQNIDEATIQPELKRCFFVSDANLVGAAYNLWNKL